MKLWGNVIVTVRSEGLTKEVMMGMKERIDIYLGGRIGQSW